MKRSTHKKGLHAVVVGFVVAAGAVMLSGCDEYELYFGRERDNCDWEDCFYAPWGDCIPLPWGDCLARVFSRVIDVHRSRGRR